MTKEYRSYTAIGRLFALEAGRENGWLYEKSERNLRNAITEIKSVDDNRRYIIERRRPRNGKARFYVWWYNIKER